VPDGEAGATPPIDGGAAAIPATAGNTERSGAIEAAVVTWGDDDGTNSTVFSHSVATTPSEKASRLLVTIKNRGRTQSTPRHRVQQQPAVRSRMFALPEIMSRHPRPVGISITFLLAAAFVTYVTFMASQP
jgi:hypothetical protein